MTLDEYALGRGKNGACYWLEFRTQKIGSIGGSTAFKHIVYFDTNQRWRYKNFLSETEAFEAVKSGLAQLLDLAERDQFADIEQVAPFTGQNLTRGKWLYMYFPGKFLPIFSTDNLADFC